MVLFITNSVLYLQANCNCMGKITTIFMENQGKLMFLCRLYRKRDALIFWERIVSISCHVAGTLFMLLAILGAWRYFFIAGVCYAAGILISEDARIPE